jgi:hypothetical protein
MPNKHKASLEKLTWKQVRKEVAEVNPALAKIIDEINPDGKHLLFKIKYPYGSEILRKSVFYVPNGNGDLVTLKDADKDIQNELCYNGYSNPVILVLKKTLELSVTFQERSLPPYEFACISAGRLFGTYWVLTGKNSHHPVFSWNMTSGSRSIFMLPKISEMERHRKLQKMFNIKASVPARQIDHWHVFRELAAHKDFPEAWQTEILCFSKDWFEHQADKAWLPFNHYLLQSAWKASDFRQNNIFWNLLFSIILSSTNTKLSPFIDDTVRYLYAIAVGAAPGFAPATNSNNAPIKGIQEIYAECYGQKKYPPIILQPSLFSLDREVSEPVYYSMNFPNAMEFSLKSRIRTSIITDLYHINLLAEKYASEIKKGEFNIEGTPLHDAINNVEFSCFHHDPAGYTLLNDSRNIPLHDNRFITKSNKQFPFRSPFSSGCIKIALKKQNHQ